MCLTFLFNYFILLQKFRISHSGWFLQNPSAIEHIGLTLFQTHWKDDCKSSSVGAKDKNETTKDTSTRETDYTTLLDQFEIETSKAGYLDIGKQQTLAYILHTSGTTGLPKVVRVPHKCIVPNIHHLQ